MDSPELTEFLERNSIKDDVAKTLSLAREHFAVIEKPWFEFIDDPDNQPVTTSGSRRTRTWMVRTGKNLSPRANFVNDREAGETENEIARGPRGDRGAGEVKELARPL